MLLVAATVGPSAIHGLGLFAREFVAAGTVTWQFRAGFDAVISLPAAHRLAPPARKQLEHYAYWDRPRGVFVLSGDDDRFTNHADEANTRCRGEDEMVAVRDIAAGEEITASYREFVMLGFKPEG